MEEKPITANETGATEVSAETADDPMLMEEHDIEELSVDGICGVY